MTTLQAQHRRMSTCHRHPTTNPITGFCASCLRERLSTIEDSVNPTTTSPHLRRTKSYTSTTNPQNAAAASSSTSEPRRKSCDVGPHANTLSSLFTLESKPETRRRDPISNAVLVLKEEEEQQQQEEDCEFRTMKEFIDLELESKNGASRFCFWESAASAFSKNLLKWKQKQQRKNKEENAGFVIGPARAKLETESEIGLYGYLGRRSCDTDPRLSVDNGRYSFDEPRASWDGYLIGKAYPRLLAPAMPIVDEKEKEKESLGNEGDKSPGGSEQTRDYYGESLSMQRRRRSFDKSSSVKRDALVDVDEVNGTSNNNNNKSGISNAKVTPETVGLFHGAKLLVTEKELRDSNWYSIKDYRSECVESDSKNVGYVGGGGGGNENGLRFKKSLRQRNVWNMWGLIQKRNEGKCVGEERFRGGKANVVDGPLVQKLKRVVNGETNGTVSEKLIRSYSVSARNSVQVDGSLNGVKGVEVKDNDGRKKDELVLQRNRSTSYSPGSLDTGLLRFYLTPVRSYRRSKTARSGLKNLQSMAMSGL